jgi:hypothetical protein
MLTIKVAYATEILSIGEFIDHISGYLEKPGDKDLITCINGVPVPGQQQLK